MVQRGGRKNGIWLSFLQQTRVVKRCWLAKEQHAKRQHSRSRNTAADEALSRYARECRVMPFTKTGRREGGR